MPFSLSGVSASAGQAHVDRGLLAGHVERGVVRHGALPVVARAAHPPASHPSLAVPPAGPRSAHVERTDAWMNRFRRLAILYEHRADIFHSFTTLGCALVCLNQIRRFSVKSVSQ